MSRMARHAAALALLGWYLIAPYVALPYNTSDSPPLIERQIRGTYDSVQACDAARIEYARERPYPAEKTQTRT